MNDTSKTICIFGGNEIASAAAIRFFKCGYDVLMAVDSRENYLRYHLCLGDALLQGQKVVEDVTAATLPEEILADFDASVYSSPLAAAAQYVMRDLKIPVIDETEFETVIKELVPQIIVNCHCEAASPVTIDHARLVVGLAPHHQPGVDCHVAVESRQTYYLGRVLSTNTLTPSDPIDSNFFKDPFSYCPTPVEGLWLALKAIGDEIRYNEAIGKIEGIEIRSPYNGQIWGLAHSGKFIPAKSNVALIYQGKATDHYRCLGFREKAVAGGLLQAVLQYGEA